MLLVSFISVSQICHQKLKLECHCSYSVYIYSDQRSMIVNYIVLIEKMANDQRIHKYFLRGHIPVQLSSCLTGLDSASLLTLKLTTYLLIWLNQNQ